MNTEFLPIAKHQLTHASERGIGYTSYRAQLACSDCVVARKAMR